ncbi:winged helix DNA-binding domain-containing protein [Schizophyllum commune Tattone D]|nr:winged helix DNA-binding domain-containing protein [Schizophyllum commune Tattone D]
MGEAPPPGGVPYPPPFVAGFESHYGPPPPAPPPAHAVPPIVAQTSQGGIPFPSPITLVSFPLDPTRWWLLGQLEYYLSPQNLATDFFLRQRMNPQGWIHIPLLASFKRVRQLTTDLQVVKEVLALSRIAQAQDEWVRPLSWQQFVLPTQPPPTETQQAPPSGQPTAEIQSSPEAHDEEEEEDVEFVLGNESSFTPAAV